MSLAIENNIKSLFLKQIPYC